MKKKVQAKKEEKVKSDQVQAAQITKAKENAAVKVKVARIVL